jgi:hypothetical protein
MSDPNPPSQKTLDKYGLTPESWREILRRQGDVCPICKGVPSTGRWVVDHEHCRGYKKMPPEERAKRVRGVCCWFCNHTYIGRAITIAKAQNVLSYLMWYNNRRALEAMSDPHGSLPKP